MDGKNLTCADEATWKYGDNRRLIHQPSTFWPSFHPPIEIYVAEKPSREKKESEGKKERKTEKKTEKKETERRERKGQ